MQFADGEPILPSTFLRSWERASNPDFAGDYSYLFNFIDGGAEKLAGEADTLTGVVADDEAMTLTVTMDAPYSNFDAVAGFQLFFPMPEAADENPTGLRERRDGRQRPVHARVGAHRRGDRPRAQRELGR